MFVSTTYTVAFYLYPWAYINILLLKIHSLHHTNLSSMYQMFSVQQVSPTKQDGFSADTLRYTAEHIVLLNKTAKQRPTQRSLIDPTALPKQGSSFRLPSVFFLTPSSPSKLKNTAICLVFIVPKVSNTKPFLHTQHTDCLYCNTFTTVDLCLRSWGDLGLPYCRAHISSFGSTSCWPKIWSVHPLFLLTVRYSHSLKFTGSLL